MNIVLYEPEIPQNTAAAGRLALATGSTLHLIKPLGFNLDEKAVRRAGLDYWKDVDLRVWESWKEFLNENRTVAIRPVSTKVENTVWQSKFSKDDYLLFGPESRGLPEEILDEHSIRIPMLPDSTRSLNLATAVAIVLYEALRQTGFPE